jgi:hypothetical protein
VEQPNNQATSEQIGIIKEFSIQAAKNNHREASSNQAGSKEAKAPARTLKRRASEQQC